MPYREGGDHSIIAVFVGAARRPLALGGMLFHMGLWATLGFRFLNLPHFLLFIDYDGEGKRVSIPPRNSSSITNPPNSRGDFR